MSTEININKNIYNSDGTVNNNRTVDLDGNTINFNDGNVGIGTTTPTEKLEVSGKTKTTTFQMTTTPTNGYVMTSDASGNGTWAAPPSSSIPQSDLIYVDSVNGVDDLTSDRGQIQKPYATVEYALANTTNTGTVTGDTTSGSATISNVSSTTNIKVGQYITGTNIPYDSIVVSKTANTIVLSKATTGTGTTLTLTWWTPKTIKIIGNIVATGNWFKPCFWFDAPNSNITWGNFALFNKTVATLVPEIINFGNLYGNHASSQFMYTLIGSGQDIYITLKNYYSIGTGQQIYIQQYDNAYRNLYLNCVSFDARFGSIGYLRGTGLTQINGYFYGLLGGLVVWNSSVINGSIETPASIYALDLQNGSHEINSQIKGSFRSTLAGQVYSLNINGTIVGTTVYLGNAGQYYQGCNVNGNIECTNLYVTQNYNTQINGRVKGNITQDSGQLTVQEFYGGNISISGATSKAYITAFGIFSQTNWYSNITLTTGAQLFWHNGPDFSVSGSYYFCQISIASTCNLTVLGKLMGDITSLAGTITVASSGYLWIIKKTAAITGIIQNLGGTIELTRNGYLNTTESATSTPTIDISTGTYIQDGGTLFCSNADSKSGLIRKTANGGKLVLKGQAYLKVANGLAPLQILSNTGTAQDVMDFSVVGNGAAGFRLADTFSDTTYGTAYAPNLIVGGVAYQDTTYSF